MEQRFCVKDSALGSSMEHNYSHFLGVTVPEFLS